MHCVMGKRLALVLSCGFYFVKVVADEIKLDSLKYEGMSSCEMLLMAMQKGGEIKYGGDK